MLDVSSTCITIYKIHPNTSNEIVFLNDIFLSISWTINIWTAHKSDNLELSIIWKIYWDELFISAAVRNFNHPSKYCFVIKGILNPKMIIYPNGRTWFKL